MPQWILFEQADGSGLAVELYIDRTQGSKPKTSLGPFRQNQFSISLKPEPDDDLGISAKEGGEQGYQQLYQDGHILQSVSCYYHFNPPKQPVIGRSADLLFALAVVVTILPAVAFFSKKSLPVFPSFAATGVLDEEGNVIAVHGISAKLMAALDSLPSESLLFYPKSNNNVVKDVIKQLATEKGIELFPISTLYDAMDKLGIQINVWTKSPYLGLQSFEYLHRAIYFGRNADIRALRELLLEQDLKGRPGVLIFGASGSGKSSLVRAGLFPALEPQHQEQEQAEHTLLQNPVFWSVWYFSQDKATLNNSVKETIAWCPRFTEQDKTEAAIVRSIQTHWSSAPQLTNLKHKQINKLAVLGEILAKQLPENRRFIWHIDQLEELFTLGFDDDVIGTFVTFLSQLQTIGVWLIVTLRNEFYQQYQKFFLQLFPRTSVYDLGQLGETELDQIITKPAERAKIKFEEDSNKVSLAAILRSDTLSGGQDVMPLLQITLEQLYEKIDEHIPYNTIKIDSYKDIGELQGAISNRAEKIFNKMEFSAQTTLDRVLWDIAIPSTASISETTENAQFTAQPIYLNNEFYTKGSPARILIDQFCDCRLLVIEKSPFTDIVWVRIAHESLLNHWDRALDILQKLSADMKVRDRLKIDAQRWLDQSCHSSLLIPGGLRLSEADKLLLMRRNFLASDIVSFIEKSKNKYRNRILSSIGAVFILSVLLYASWFFFDQAGEANNKIFAGEYARESESLLRKNPENSQLLAIKAYRMHASANTGYALRKAFLRQQSLRRTLWEHIAPINNIAFSADGLTLIASSLDGKVRFWDSDSGHSIGLLDGRIFDLDQEEKLLIVSNGLDDRTARLWNITNNSEIATLTGHRDGISTVGFSPNSRIVATGSKDGSIRLWDPLTGHELKKLTGHTKAIRKLVFSPNGHTLASTSEFGPVHLWNTSTGRKFALLEGHQNTVKSIFFSLDGKLLVTLCADKILRIWDASIGDQVDSLEITTGFIQTAAFQPNDQLLAIADSHGDIQLWNIASRNLIRLLQGHTGPINALVFSKDGKTLASASDDTTIRIWSIREGLQISVLSAHTKRVNAIAFSPNGHLLASAGYDGSVRIWDMRVGQIITELDESKARDQVTAFSPDGGLLATIGKNQDILVFDTKTGKIETRLSDHPRNLTDIAWSPNGEKLAIASRDSVRIWNISNKKYIDILLNRSNITELGFSYDGKKLAIAGKHAMIWNLINNENIPLKGLSGQVFGVILNPVKRVLATIGNEPFIRLWDIDKGEETAKFESDDGYYSYNIYKGIFSPDGNTLAAIDEDSSFWIWDIVNNRKLAFHMLDEVSANHRPSIVFSPEGKTIAVSEGNKAWLWDIKTSKKIAYFIGHTDKVNDIAFNSDGSLLATASSDSTVRLWNTKNAREITVLEGHSQSVKKVIFSPNNHTLVTITINGKMRLWDCEMCRHPNELIIALINRLDRNLSDEMRHNLGFQQTKNKEISTLMQFKE